MLDLLLDSYNRDALPEERSGQLLDYLNAVNQEIQFSGNVTVCKTTKASMKPLDPALGAACYGTVDGERVKLLLLSPLWFIGWDELPDHLRVDEWDDVRLENRMFYQQLSDWISEKFDSKKHSISMEDIATVHMVIMMRKNPAQAQLSFQALVAHELGHLSYDHHDASVKLERVVTRTAMAATGILMLAGSYLTANGKGKYGMPLITLAPVVSYISSKIILDFRSRNDEAEADQFSGRRLAGSVEGAEYGFSCAKKAMEQVSRSKALHPWERLISKVLFFKGDFLPFLFTHGSFATRLDNIKAGAKLIDTA